MNKKIILSLLMCVVMLIFASCGPTPDPEPPASWTVTFDFNYEGSTPLTQTVEDQNVAQVIGDPTREHYSFGGWFYDAQCLEPADFEFAIEEDTTFYALWTLAEICVTFNYNYEGSTETKQWIEVGSTALQPANPEREGFMFGGWFTSETCTEQFSFDTELSADTTVYAKWEEDDGDSVKLTYMWNYDGAPNNGVCNVATIKTNSKTQAFAAQRENFYLGGWYTDEQCTTKFDFTKRVTKSVTLFAKWLNIFTFEAEYVDLTGMIGNGYSGQTAGKGLIQVAKAEHMASNGHYVGWMYKEGNTLTFNINSDKAVSDAVLVLRLSAEFYDMTFSPSNYTVSVNGTALNYNAIEMTNVPIQGSNQYKAFANFTISTTVQLNEGANVVQLVISNADRLGESGTMYATAPLTDCIYIYTDAQLTWNPLLDNID